MKIVKLTIADNEYEIHCERDPGRITVVNKGVPSITITDMSSGQPVQRVVDRRKYEEGVIDDVK